MGAQPISFLQVMLSMMHKNEKLSAITNQLEAGVQSVFQSEQYKSYLQTMAKFYHYSANNCLLIHLQRPDATHVASYTTWKRLGRQVNQGETGIAILCPISVKRKQEKAEDTANADERSEESYTIIPAYKIGYTFDISQTSGKELPEIARELDGNISEYHDFLHAIMRASPVSVGFEEISSGAKGYFHTLENRIAIQQGMSERQTVKTAIHEIAHAMLDNSQSAKQEQNPVDRRTREVRAESVAFCVCSHYGIDTSDYSFGYIAAWSASQKLEELHANLDIIHETSRTMIERLDRALGRDEKRMMQPLLTPQKDDPFTLPAPRRHRAR